MAGAARSERGLALAMIAARTAAEHKGRDIVVLDMRRNTSLFDFFVIATGSSRRQLHAISDEIERALAIELKDKKIGIEGYDESRWIVLDYGDVVIHVFDEDTRKFYGLENLWADAEPVDVGGVVA
ncbi:MAG: ribosome silencing factor [Planctomycetes bacterium]|nr:ribosome silencing factor [Planctomycetota bacterium]